MWACAGGVAYCAGAQSIGLTSVQKAGAGAINEAYCAFPVSGCERNTISADLAGVSIQDISEQTQAFLKV